MKIKSKICLITIKKILYLQPQKDLLFNQFLFVSSLKILDYDSAYQLRYKLANQNILKLSQFKSYNL